MAIEKEIIIKAKTADANKNIDKTTKELNKTNEAANSVNSQIDNITGGALTKFKSFTKGIKGVSKGFGGLRSAIIATGLGILIVLVGSLVEYFSNFEAGVKVVNQIMNTLAGTVNAIVANFQKLLKGDFLGFFKGVAEGAKDSWENTDKLFLAQQRLFELNKKFIVENAKLNAEIEAQARIVRDTTLSYEERLKAQEKINESSEQLIQNEKELAEAELERLSRAVALENDYEKRRDLEIEIEQTMANLISVESRLAAERDKANRAQRQILEEQQRQEDDRVAKAKEAGRKIAQERAAEKKAILDIENNFKKQIEDLEDKTEEDRLARSKSRALLQIQEMKGNESDKENARLEVLEFFAAKEKELQDKKDADLQLAEDKRQDAILKIRESYIQKTKDLEEITELQKIENNEIKALAELESLNATEEQKLETIKYYEGLKTDAIKAEEQAREDTEKANADARKAIAEEEFKFKMKQAREASEVLGQLSDLVGKQTAAGKALGIASALINTYVGVSEALKQKSTLPSPFDVIAKVANVATVLKTGFNAVKAIKAVNVPGGGGGGSSAAMSAGGGGGGTAPPAFNVVGTSGANQIAEQLGQDQDPIQAYVVGSNVTSQQEMDRNIVDTATLG